MTKNKKKMLIMKARKIPLLSQAKMLGTETMLPYTLPKSNDNNYNHPYLI
jgi:hypothetical protein